MIFEAEVLLAKALGWERILRGGGGGGGWVEGIMVGYAWHPSCE